MSWYVNSLSLCKLRMKVHICTVDKLFSPGALENYELTATYCFSQASQGKFEKRNKQPLETVFRKRGKKRIQTRNHAIGRNSKKTKIALPEKWTTENSKEDRKRPARENFRYSHRRSSLQYLCARRHFVYFVTFRTRAYAWRLTSCKRWLSRGLPCRINFRASYYLCCF